MPEEPAPYFQMNKGVIHRLILIVVSQDVRTIPWLSDWAQSLKQTDHNRIAWVTLGTEDQEPLVFWSDLLGAVRNAGGDRVDSLDFDREIDESFCLVSRIEDLINYLADGIEEFFLVFERYHLIGRNEIHLAIQHLIDYLPDRAHVVIVSKEEPPLQLSRLRVRRQIIEINADRRNISAG